MNILNRLIIDIEIFEKLDVVLTISNEKQDQFFRNFFSIRNFDSIISSIHRGI